jgi:hypothetical protein
MRRVNLLPSQGEQNLKGSAAVRLVRRPLQGQGSGNLRLVEDFSGDPEWDLWEQALRNPQAISDQNWRSMPRLRVAVNMVRGCLSNALKGGHFRRVPLDQLHPDAINDVPFAEAYASLGSRYTSAKVPFGNAKNAPPIRAAHLAPRDPGHADLVAGAVLRVGGSDYMRYGSDDAMIPFSGRELPRLSPLVYWWVNDPNVHSRSRR